MTVEEDFERFRSLIVGMAQIYDNPVCDVLLAEYWAVLKHLDLPAFESILGRLLRELPHMPSPYHFLGNAAQVLRAAARPDLRP